MLGRGGAEVIGAAGRGAGGGAAGRGAGAAAGFGAAAAAGILAGAFGRAVLRADFFAVFLAVVFAERFLAATFARPLLRAGAALLAVLPRFAFFAFDFFAIIDLPIVRLSRGRALPAGSPRLGPLSRPI